MTTNKQYVYLALGLVFCTQQSLSGCQVYIVVIIIIKAVLQHYTCASVHWSNRRG